MNLKTYNQDLSDFEFGEKRKFPQAMTELSNRKVIAMLANCRFGSNPPTLFQYAAVDSQGRDLLTRDQTTAVRVYLENAKSIACVNRVPLASFMVIARNSTPYRKTRSGLFFPINQVVNWNQCHVENVEGNFETGDAFVNWQIWFE